MMISDDTCALWVSILSHGLTPDDLGVTLFRKPLLIHIIIYIYRYIYASTYHDMSSHGVLGPTILTINNMSKSF